MQSINIISVYDIANNLADILTVFRQARIKVQLTAILQEQFRILIERMERRKSSCTLGASTIRINPRMKLHVALVTFVNHPLQRIPLRRFSLNTSEITAPWFVIGLIERIGFGTNLEDDSIDTRFLQGIKLGSKHTLHLLCSHTLELSVHTLNPSSTELTLRRFGLSRHREGQHAGSQSCQKSFYLHCLVIFF